MLQDEKKKRLDKFVQDISFAFQKNPYTKDQDLENP